MISQVLQFSLLPAVCMLVGGLIATVRRPGEKLTSATQHFAGGVVFAAVAIELLPQISHTKQPLAISIGFLFGLGLMILVKQVTGGHAHDDDDGHTHDHDETPSSKLPIGMIAAVAIDVFIDGALIGIAFKAGVKDGMLIAIALAIEILFLGLSTAATIARRGISRLTNTIVTLALTPIVLMGAILSVLTINILPATWLTGIMAFGVAALLYLVTEELLVEAHEVDETPLITAMFFIGFLAIFLLDTQF